MTAGVAPGRSLLLVLAVSAARQAAAQTCPPGTEDIMGSGEACVFCTPGKYDSDRDPDTLCDMCSAGTVAAEGWTYCDDCPSGTYAEAGESSGLCIACEPGKYSADVAGECIDCTHGEFDHDSDPSTVCQFCHKGSYTPPVSTRCLDCSPGMYDHDSTPATVCKMCAPGTYTNLTVYAACSQCTAGQYDDDSNASTPCIFCPPGMASVLLDDNGEQILIFQDGQYGSYSYRASNEDNMPPAATLEELLETRLLPPNNFPNTMEAGTPNEGTWNGVGAIQATDCQSCTMGQFADQHPSWDPNRIVLQTIADRALDPTWKTGAANGDVMGAAMFTDCLDCVGGSYGPEDGMFACLICKVRPCRVHSCALRAFRRPFACCCTHA